MRKLQDKKSIFFVFWFLNNRSKEEKHERKRDFSQIICVRSEYSLSISSIRFTFYWFYFCSYVLVCRYV